MKNHAISINGTTVQPGTRVTIDIKVPRMYTHTETNMPVQVIHGRKDGARLFVCAALHGDEINGIEIIRRLLKHKALNRLSGTLIAIPIVNVYGVIHHSRYLPDRRDLNRSFPGSEQGSLAARLADLFMREIVQQCTHGIDLHTGAVHRDNFPQIRANLDDEYTMNLARAFGVPLLLNSVLRDGSMRQAAAEAGIPVLLYEAGEALRFDEVAIRAGVNGIMNVMRELGMLAPSKRQRIRIMDPLVARSSAWIRAPESGILRTLAALGAQVEKGQLIGMISDPFNGSDTEVLAPGKGVIIGRTNIPLVNEGDALFHMARYGRDVDDVAQHVEFFQEGHLEELENDEDLPIV